MNGITEITMSMKDLYLEIRFWFLLPFAIVLILIMHWCYPEDKDEILSPYDY